MFNHPSTKQHLSSYFFTCFKNHKEILEVRSRLCYCEPNPHSPPHRYCSSKSSSSKATSSTIDLFNSLTDWMMDAFERTTSKAVADTLTEEEQLKRFMLEIETGRGHGVDVMGYGKTVSSSRSRAPNTSWLRNELRTVFHVKERFIVKQGFETSNSTALITIPSRISSSQSPTSNIRVQPSSKPGAQFQREQISCLLQHERRLRTHTPSSPKGTKRTFLTHRKLRDAELTNHLHWVQRLRMSGPLGPHLLRSRLHGVVLKYNENNAWMFITTNSDFFLRRAHTEMSVAVRAMYTHKSEQSFQRQSLRYLTPTAFRKIANSDY